MIVNGYIAAKGSGFSDKDAKVIGPELLKLANKGQSSARAILAAASPQRSPLHRYFEWDDATAAQTHREWQARNLAKAIYVKVASPSGREHTMRAFHAVRIETSDGPSRQKHYLPISVVAADADYSEQVIAEARRQLRSWRDRWAAYRDEFGPIFPAIDEMLLEEEVAA